MAKGENIFKRKDGRWEARYIKGYKLSGKNQVWVLLNLLSPELLKLKSLENVAFVVSPLW